MNTPIPAQINWNSGDPPEGPIIETEPPTPPVWPAPGGRSVTLQSIAIEAKIATCSNCRGIHHVQQCPEIARALFADPPPEQDPPPWSDIALGRELCRMKWHRFQAFVHLLASVPRAHLVMYAASYQAFIRSHAPDSTMTINDVLAAWSRMIARNGRAQETA